MRNTLFHLVQSVALLLVTTAAAWAQPVSLNWPLTSNTVGNSSTPAIATANAQGFSAGTAPTVTIFDYAGNTAQRLNAGSTGWTAGPAQMARHLQFDALPAVGQTLNVTSVTFDYGATNVPGQIKAEVRYSTDNWSSSTVLTGALSYPASGFATYTAPITLASIPSGGKFSLRILPYASVDSTPITPPFAVHKQVKINGSSATPASSTADLSVTKTCAINGPQSVLCTVAVTNNGTTPSVIPFKLTDTVTGAPSDAIFTGGGGSLPISCTPGAGPVTPIACTTGNFVLQPGSGQSKNALFSFKLPNGGTFTNCATVTQGSPSTESNTSNNTACTTITVPPPASIPHVRLHLHKSTGSNAVPGTYTFGITCTGGSGPYTGPATVSLVVPPNPSVTTILNVPQGATCTVTETPPTPSSAWANTAQFGGSTSPISVLGPWQAAIGPMPVNTSMTVTNVAAGTGTLKIVKKVSQPPSTQAFNFTMVGPGLTGATLDDDGINGNPLSNSKTFGNVGTGVPLTVTEDAVAGWTVSSIVCLPAGSGTTVNLATRTLTANLTAGANVTCTFTNSQIGNGKLTLRKVLIPATDPGKFTIAISTSSGTLLGNFLNGSNGATAGPMTVPTGTYVVSETAGSTSPTTLAQYTSVISGVGCAGNGAVTIAAGDNKVCTITNTRNTVTWPNTATVNIYNPMTPFGPQIVNIAAGGTVTFNNVNSGANWTITSFSGPTFSPVPLANNATGVTVPLTVPGTYTYVISGTPSITVHGQIIVH